MGTEWTDPVTSVIYRRAPKRLVSRTTDVLLITERRTSPLDVIFAVVRLALSGMLLRRLRNCQWNE